MAEFDADAVTVKTSGTVPDEVRRYAQAKVAGAAALVRDPVLFAEVKLTEEPNPSRDRPAVAEATLDVNGHPVRAQVAASAMQEAVDLLVDRLGRRLRRYEEQLHREGRDRHRTGEAHGGGWRHGDLPSQRLPYYDRPRDERELVRTKRFDLSPISLDEAAFDLDMLGHDFYLFTEASTGADAVVFYRNDGESLGVQLPEGVSGDPTDGCATEVDLVAPAPVLARNDAIERLESGNERFVFHLDPKDGRGAVVYRRYDGNWGLITARA